MVRTTPAWADVLMGLGGITLGGLVLVALVLAICLPITLWGRWKALLISLTITTGVVIAATVALIGIVETIDNYRSGIPDYIEVLAAVGLGTSALLALILLAVGLTALVMTKRWGVLIGLGLLPMICAFVVLAAFVPYANLKQNTSKGNDSRTVSTHAGRAASEGVAAWVAQVNGEPRITIGDLADEPPEPPPVDGIESIDEAPVPTEPGTQTSATEEKSSKRPGWIDGTVAANQKVFTSGPFTSKNACWDAAAGDISEWMRERFNNAYPELASNTPRFLVDLDRVIKAEHTEQRETSVGEMHLLYTLVEIDDSQRQAFAAAAEGMRRHGGLRAVAIGGGLLLGAVGLLHGFLRAGGRRAETR